MPARTTGRAKRPHPADVRDREAIANAASFAAHLRVGPFESYTYEADTLELARDIGLALEEKYSRFGRRAMVYALSKDGARTPVPRDYAA